MSSRVYFSSLFYDIWFRRHLSTNWIVLQVWIITQIFESDSLNWMTIMTTSEVWTWFKTSHKKDYNKEVSIKNGPLIKKIWWAIKGPLYNNLKLKEMPCKLSKLFHSQTKGITETLRLFKKKYRLHTYRYKSYILSIFLMILPLVFLFLLNFWKETRALKLPGSVIYDPLFMFQFEKRG